MTIYTSMPIKIGSSALATNSAGQVVEAIAIRLALPGETNIAGSLVDVVSTADDPIGRPVRIVTGKSALNSAGQWMDTLPVMASPGGNLLMNGQFSSDAVWNKGAGWTITSGAASFVAGAASSISQAVPFIGAGVYELSYTIASLTGDTITPSLGSGTPAYGVARTSPGAYVDTLTAATGNLTLAIAAGPSANAVIQNVSLKKVG